MLTTRRDAASVSVVLTSIAIFGVPEKFLDAVVARDVDLDSTLRASNLYSPVFASEVEPGIFPPPIRLKLFALP